MKTVVLCGGFGTRLSEETTLKPKPMVPVGTKPILWHILNIYEKFGYSDFTLALGYKADVIKEYFLNYYHLDSDFSIDLRSGTVQPIRECRKAWNLDLIDTGYDTLTGGRLHRLEAMLRPKGTFMLTYGDGVADVDIAKLVEFHKSHGKIATVTAVRPPARFGGMNLGASGEVLDFKEKPQTGEGWINGGFFVFEPEVFDYLSGDRTVLEGDPMERLTGDGQLVAYQHMGFWQCMDTVRDKQTLDALWESGRAPWLTPEAIEGGVAHSVSSPSPTNNSQLLS